MTKKLPDADCVYSGEFYFFNINVHRTSIMIEFEEDGEMTVVWAGNYNDYEKTFKNNRNVIKKWLEITNGFKTKEKRFSERIEYLTAHHQIKQGIC